MSNKQVLLNALNRLYNELHALNHDESARAIWIEMGRCYLFAEELLSKQEHEDLLLTIFEHKMLFSSLEYCKSVSRNFIHHYLESVEERIDKRKEFPQRIKISRELYDVTSLGDTFRKMI